MKLYYIFNTVLFALILNLDSYAQILGPTNVQQGTTHSYVDMSNTSPTWQVAGGQIVSSGSSGCDILWHTKGTGSVLHGGVTLYVSVVGDLVPGSIGGAKTICYNTSAGTLQNISSASECGTRTYTWQKSNNNSSWTDIQNTNSASYSPGNLTSTTYYRRKVVGSCGQTKYTASQKITVKSLPNTSSLSFDGEGTYCNGTGGTLRMYDVNGTSRYNSTTKFHLYKLEGGSWVEKTYKNLAASSSSSPLQIVFNTDHPNNSGNQNYRYGAGKYKVKIMHNGCFVDWSRVQEVQLENPIGLNVPTVTYYKCPGESITIQTSELDAELYAFPEINNTYKIPGYSKSGSSIIGDFDEGTYYAGRSSNDECVSRARTEISIIEYDRPAMPDVDAAIADQSMCIEHGMSTSVAFNVNELSGISYKWYDHPTEGNHLGDGPSFNTLVNSSGIHRYYVRAHKECENLESTAKEVKVSLTVGLDGSKLGFTGAGTYCNEDGGGSLQLYDIYGTTAYPPDVTFYLYRVEDDGTHVQLAFKNLNASLSNVPDNPSNALHIIFNNDGENNPTYNEQIYPSGHYRVKAMYGHCEEWVAEGDIDVTQYKKPEAPLVPASIDFQTACIEENTTTNFTFTVEEEEGATYRWYDQEVDGSVLSIGPEFSTELLPADGVTRYFYVRKYKNCEANESLSTQVSCVIYNTPALTLPAQQVFENNDVDLGEVANKLGGIWRVNDQSMDFIDAGSYGLGIHQFVVEYSKYGCTVSEDFEIEVISPPSIDLIGFETLKTNREVQLVLQNFNPDLSYIWLKNDLIVPDQSPINTRREGTTLYSKEKGKFRVKAINDQGYVGFSNVVVLSDPKDQSELNYVRSHHYRVPIKSENEITNPLAQEDSGYDYFDGIGRQVQKVICEISPNEKDIIKGWELDENGRKIKSYLTIIGAPDGQFNPYLEEDNNNFYDDHFGDNAGDHAFSETEYESSPLNRPLKSFAPGQAWAKEGGDKPVTFDYQTNTTDEVAHWELAGNELKKVGAYDPGTLYKTVTTDENENQVQEFKNLQGQVVLKKVQNSDVATANDDDWLQTYYVYDDFGNLRYVMPPMATQNYLTDGQYVPDGTNLISESANYEDITNSSSEKVAFLPPATITINSGTELEPGAEIYSIEVQEDNFVLNQLFVDRWIFQYRYDSRQRMVMKQVPGADSVLMVYDKRDRLVMTQDGNQREDGKWSFTKYDQLNRPVLTGIIADARSRTDIQTEVNALTDGSPYYEEYTGTGPLHGYDNTGYPTGTTEADVLTVTYYDNYNFSSDSHWSLGDYSNENQAKTYVTGAKVRVDLPDGSYDWNESVTLYDSRYRVASSVSKDYQDNYDSLVNEYYSLVHPLVVKTTHYHESALTNTADTITKVFDYDHADRLMSVTHQINSDPAVILLENEYNELGELITKKLNKIGTDQYSQEVDYEYNIRGWLTKINDPVTPDPEDYFAMQLKYHEAGQYNGNIGATAWKNPFEDSQNQYDYTYDPVNRLKSAAYNSGAFSVPNIDYDANGNIMALQRKGLDDTGITTDWDDLDYKYVGNQLIKVDDGGSADLGFKDGASASTEYEYDANGNMTSDANKGIESIEYNHLNLPIVVTLSNVEGSGNSGRIEYIYDAAGTKLAQIVYEGGTQTKRTDYQGTFIYESKDEGPSQLQFIQHEEGRIVYETDVNGDFVEYEYQYHLKDHLGNVRATFKEEGDQEQSLASFEPAVQTNESNYFTGYDGMVKITAELFNHTAGGNTSIRLNGSTNEREGLGKSLKVKPGDVIDMEVYAKYFLQSESGGWTNAMNTMVSNIASNVGGIVVDGGGIGADANPFVDWSGKTNPTSAPKAYLNYMVFDEYYNPISELTGHQQISELAKETGVNVTNENPTGEDHEKLEHSITITQSGYVYIYLSNEEDTPIDVFFDDFTVTQHHTPIVSKDDYYPFGLTFASYNRPASTGQNFKYNGKEEISALGLNWTDYGARMLDKALGRWWVIDPLAEKYHPISTYAYVLNNPIVFIDPDGREVQFAKGASKEFKKQFGQAVQHLNKNGAGGMLAKLHSSKEVYIVGETEGGSSYNATTKTISWDPNTGLLTDEFVALSPTSILNHEVDHALQDDQNPEQQDADGDTPDPDYGNKEEKRVITGSEQETAKKLGEIGEGEVTRTNHNGSLLPTSGPTSTDMDVVIEADRIEEDEN